MTVKVDSQALYTSELKPDQNSAGQIFGYCRSMLLQGTLSRQRILMQRSISSRIGVHVTQKAFQQKARPIRSIELLFTVCTTNGFGATPLANAPATEITANLDTVFTTQVAPSPPPV